MRSVLGNKRLILASKSPRRSELLKAADIPFELHLQEVDETVDPNVHPMMVAEVIADKKAEAAWQEVGNSEVIVLAADSVVILGKKIFGKPKTADEAFLMLSHLSGRIHTVVTGVVLKSNEKKVSFSSKTLVSFREMVKEEIDYYISEYEPFDKAGAYGIQDWIGMCKVSEIHGTYSNVMGLPIDLVYEGLKQLS